MSNGWVKIYPKMLKNPVVTKDSEYLAVWIYLLLNAVWKETDVMFGGERITLKPGQLTTGRRKIASELKVSESKVQRILKVFEIEQQIEQRTDHQCRLISIVHWDEYQNCEQRNEQRVNNDRTTSEQRVNTKEEYKTNKKVKTGKTKDKYSAEREEIIAYFNEVCGTKYRPDTKAIKKLIDGLLDQNFTVDDFKTVIYKKAKQWLHDPEMCKFVRPQTLFTGKFEGYLNEVEALSFEERLWMA